MNKPAQPNDSRGTSLSADGRVGVIVAADTRPGLRAVGPYVPGKVYRVAPAEAVRLVTAKGFQYATPEDARTAAAYLEQLNAAALPDTAEPAAVADGQGSGTPLTPAQE